MPVIKKDEEGDGLLIEFNEKLSGEDIQVPADLVILMVGMEAHDDAKKVSHLAGISMCGDGFFIEKHPKLDPVATTTDGVFVVGSCQAPKDIPDSVCQAKAATARVLDHKKEEIRCDLIVNIPHQEYLTESRKNLFGHRC